MEIIIRVIHAKLFLPQLSQYLNKSILDASLTQTINSMPYLP